MGGKKNKSKKFLRQRHQKKHNKQNKKKKNENDTNHIMTQSASKQDTKNTKKARELFNAGINALNEQPQIDVGLQYQRSDLMNDDDDQFDDGMDIDNASTSGDYGGSEDMSDVMSLQSEVTIFDDDIDLNDHLVDNEIDDLLDDINDKDSNIRIKAIKRLNNELRTRRTNEDDFTEKNQRLTLVSKYLANSIRKGSVNEKLHALDTIALLALSLSDTLDYFVKYFQNMMKNLIQRPKSAVVQIKAINTWAIMVWSLGGDGASSKLATLKIYEYFWNYNLREEEQEEYSYDINVDDENESDDDDEAKDNDIDKQRASTEISTAAMDAWLFLITSINDAAMIGSLLDQYYDTLLRLLRLESTTVLEKIHIGKALTVLIDNYMYAMDNYEEFEQQNVNLDAIMNEFHHLKSNSKQHRKKEFLNQKAKFRDYLKTLEHKWTPLIVIKLHHKKFQVSGWNQWVQYHSIKQVLLNGLQAHLLQNTKIKEAFGIEIDAEPIQISKHEKKSKKQENIENQRNIKKDRMKKRDNKRGFMFDKSLVD